MNETVAVTLESEDWVALGKFLVANCGKMVDIMPAMRLVDALCKAGIDPSKMQPKQ